MEKIESLRTDISELEQQERSLQTELDKKGKPETREELDAAGAQKGEMRGIRQDLETLKRQLMALLPQDELAMTRPETDPKDTTEYLPFTAHKPVNEVNRGYSMVG